MDGTAIWLGVMRSHAVLGVGSPQDTAIRCHKLECTYGEQGHGYVL